jgi:hypothetical protein
MNRLEKARVNIQRSMDAGIEESITNAEMIHLRDAVRHILSYLEAQEAAKPDEPEQRPGHCCSCDHWRSIVILAADTLGADSYESTSVDHAARRVVKDRDRLQAALAEQMAENRRLARKLEDVKATLDPVERWE